ncbi:MAG: DMT family transporter [Rhizobiaceae bacterium]|nr:DMT family transporter [Rhizobiaceae bacterium]
MSDKYSNAQSISTGAWLAAFSAIALAFTNIAAPVVYGAGGNPPTVLMLRAFATIVVIGFVLIVTGRLRRLSWRDEINCMISGLLFMFAGFGLLTALEIAPASVVVLVLYLFPLLTTLFDAFVNRRFPATMTIILLLVALFGLALSLDAAGDDITMAGILLALLAAVSAAVTLVWNNHKLGAVDPEQITFRMFCVSFIVFGGYLLFYQDFSMPKGEGGLIYLGLMLACFAAAFFTMFRAVQMAGSVRAAMIMNLEPVVTIVLSVLILNEIINPQHAIGIVLVLGAVLFSQFQPDTTPAFD